MCKGQFYRKRSLLSRRIDLVLTDQLASALQSVTYLASIWLTASPYPEVRSNILARLVRLAIYINQYIERPTHTLVNRVAQKAGKPGYSGKLIRYLTSDKGLPSSHEPVTRHAVLASLWQALASLDARPSSHHHPLWLSFRVSKLEGRSPYFQDPSVTMPPARAGRRFRSLIPRHHSHVHDLTGSSGLELRSRLSTSSFSSLTAREWKA